VEGRLVEDSTPGLFVLEARLTAVLRSTIHGARHGGPRCSPGGKIGSMEDRQVVAG
jgi:hypothetical protein